MNGKRLLKFYFGADGLNRALDNIMIKHAMSSGDYLRGGEYYAEKIFAVISAKDELSKLWRYLDGVIASFKDSEKKVLKFYGGMRGGIAKLSQEERREIKRVTVKFSRRARSVERFESAVNLVKKYYCLIGGIKP